jgi:periplasmic divalent cation tolerance protein
LWSPNWRPAFKSLLPWPASTAGKGDIEVAQECQLWIKSTDEKKGRNPLTSLKESHSYEVPEFIQIPITYGLPEYLHWVLEETKAN